MLNLFQEIFVKNIAVVIVILLTGLIVGRISGKITKYFLINLKYHEIKIHRIAQNLTRYIIYLLTIYLILKTLNLEIILLSLLLILSVFSILMYSFIKTIDFIVNFSAWFYVKSALKEGSQITLSKLHGKIKKINLTNVKIIKDDEVMFLSNIFIKKSIQDN